MTRLLPFLLGFVLSAYILPRLWMNYNPGYMYRNRRINKSVLCDGGGLA